jgi:hypothetical protein
MPRKPRSRRSRSHRKVRGGRRTDEERLTAKCAGQTDPVSLDGIPPQFAIRLTEGGVTKCWDIRSLEKWLLTGKHTNPLTNLDFSAENITKIVKKIQKELRNFVMDDQDFKLYHLLVGRGKWFPRLYLFKPGVEKTRGFLFKWSQNYFVNEFNEEVDDYSKEVDRKYELVITPGGLESEDQCVSFFTKDHETFNNLYRLFALEYLLVPDDNYYYMDHVRFEYFYHAYADDVYEE